MPKRFHISSYLLKLLAGLCILLALALALAWIGTGFQGLQGWFGFLVGVSLGVGIVTGYWHLMQFAEGGALPNRLISLVLGGIILRLVAALIWYLALPAMGHGSAPELAGYVATDAFQRDQAAWQFSQSTQPLWQAFTSPDSSDPYGGFLFLSATFYRYLGGSIHQPLQITLLSIIFSSLAICLAWAVGNRLLNPKVAWLAAWVVTLFPDAVLLGSSQMREAFSMTLTAAAFYGLMRFNHERSWHSLGWILIPILLYIPLSPPLSALLSCLLILAGLPMLGILKRLKPRNVRLAWLILFLAILLVISGLWLALRQFTPASIHNPLEMAQWWLRKAADLQLYESRQASGWMQKIFRTTPDWTHMPLLVLYGSVQPFLPAALIAASSAPIWKAIAIWRAVGWTTLLPFLVYTLFYAFSRRRISSLVRLLTLVAWIGILLAAYRGGGDLWDNPRYRVTFIALQACLVAWAWVEGQRTRDPWFRRALVGVALMLLWFLPWYLRRYTPFPWPVVDLFQTLGAGLASAILYIIFDIARLAKKATQPPV